MSSRLKFIFLPIFISAILSSCTHRYYIDNVLRSELHLTRDQLIGLPVELSQKIVLYDAEAGSKLSGNAEIIFPKGTKGIIVDVAADRLWVRFEPGEKNLLVFGASSPTSVYTLMAKNWTDRHGEVEYGGRRWFISPGGGEAAIIVRGKELIHEEKRTRRVRGIVH